MFGIRASVIVAFSILVLFSRAEAAECNLKEVAAMDMVAASDGTSLIPVHINGSEKHLIFDIGTGSSALTKNVIDQLQLSTRATPKDVTPYYFGQQIKELATVPALQIGNVTGKDLVVYVLPNNTSFDARVSGILGLAALEKLDIELDYKRNKFHLFSQDHCKGQVVYWTQSFTSVPIKLGKLGNFSVAMELDGRPVSASFGMTEETSSLSMNNANRIFDLRENSPGMQEVPLANSSQDEPITHKYPFKSLSANGLTINNPNILVRGRLDPSRQPCDENWHSQVGKLASISCFGNGADLRLGTHILRQLHLYFAFGENTLYLSAAGAE